MSSEKTDTRTRILDAAWGLLESRDGPARMADIARAAGISRQALYMHFPNRADLLIATTRHIDAVKDIDARLVPSRTAETGRARLDAFVEAWGAYIPEIQGVARALMAMQEADAEARRAWADRMAAVREGCAAAVDALARDGDLAPGLSPEAATDLLWTLLSVPNWAHLTGPCGWSQADYRHAMTRLARAALVAPDG
ncbi:TetR/AcrR family transcriptional regulator [Roseospira navarrensis]|uniref:TetR family transcriptional regulator n=1 Tax=Roseospira navarrensis TaxID=140058 RepID=A0A7X2D3B5_9PROT|nr:TetR/AcrR family transcriptional regulator [Roseospira navarrensis]MQX36638.1 TetR family transcriptional regulator [Roseospira navarrensis]